MNEMGEKNRYIALISEDGVAALRKLIGVEIATILTTTVDVYDVLVTAPHFSIPLRDDRYIIMENDWDVTPEERFDICQMMVSIAASPKNIAVGEVEGVECLLPPVTRIHIRPPSGITRIEIYTTDRDARREAVSYDSAVVFRLSDGRGLAIAPEASAWELVEYTEEPSEIKRYTTHSSLRVKLE